MPVGLHLRERRLLPSQRLGRRREPGRVQARAEHRGDHRGQRDARREQLERHRRDRDRAAPARPDRAAAARPDRRAPARAGRAAPGRPSSSGHRQRRQQHGLTPHDRRIDRAHRPPRRRANRRSCVGRARIALQPPVVYPGRRVCLGVPGEVVELWNDADVLMGHVDFGGVRRTVCLDHVRDVQPGEFVLVHVGFALTRIEPRRRGACSRCSPSSASWRADEVPRRVPRRDAALRLARGDPPRGHSTVGADGGVRRADPLDRPLRPRRAAAAAARARARPGLPGVRHAARDHRPRARDRAPSRGHAVLVRRHAARARLDREPARPARARRRRARRLLAARRSRDRRRASRAPGRAVRDRLRDHRAGERDGGRTSPTSAGSRTSACSCRTCSCRRRSPP